MNSPKSGGKLFEAQPCSVNVCGGLDSNIIVLLVLQLIKAVEFARIVGKNRLFQFFGCPLR